jgi:hypothetical protein
MPSLQQPAPGSSGSQVWSMGSVVGGDGTSMYIVDWQADRGCHWIYPAESASGGLIADDKGEIPVNDVDSNPFFAAVTEYMWAIGLAVEDPRRIARIANIDVSDANLGASATQGQLSDKLIDVLSLHAEPRRLPAGDLLPGAPLGRLPQADPRQDQRAAHHGGLPEDADAALRRHPHAALRPDLHLRGHGLVSRDVEAEPAPPSPTLSNKENETHMPIFDYDNEFTVLGGQGPIIATAFTAATKALDGAGGNPSTSASIGTRDWGAGEPVRVYGRVTQAFNNLTSLDVQVGGADDNAGTNFVVYLTTNFLLAALTLNALLPVGVLPAARRRSGSCSGSSSSTASRRPPARSCSAWSTGGPRPRTASTRSASSTQAADQGLPGSGRGWAGSPAYSLRAATGCYGATHRPHARATPCRFTRSIRSTRAPTSRESGSLRPAP